ncbi:MAG: MFS transporter [Desulfosarcina sp.]|nr:MFS transporter [Desulfobacterales bacterium]
MPGHTGRVMLPRDTKIFNVLFFSIFATVTGVGIVVPLLPIYARDIGAGGFYIGMIFGIFSIARTAFIPVFGRASDRHGRKPFIVVGMLGYALISLAYIAVSNVPGLFVVRFFQGIASAMMMPVLQAYVGDITPTGRESFTMGYFNLATFAGLSLGPLLGGVVSDHWSLDAAFIMMGLLALFGFLACALLLPPTQSERALRRGTPPMAWRRLVQDPEIRGLFAFRLAYTAGIGVIWGFLPIYADQRFQPGSAAIGLLIMSGVLVSGLFQVPMGYLADRVNKPRMVAAGGTLAGMALLGFTWADSFTEMLLGSLIFGMGGGIAMPALMGLAVKKGAALDAMGSVMSLLTLAHSLGMMMGALLAGCVMDWFELTWAFPLGTGIMLAGVAAFWYWIPPPVHTVRGERKPPGPTTAQMSGPGESV